MEHDGTTEWSNEHGDSGHSKLIPSDSRKTCFNIVGVRKKFCQQLLSCVLQRVFKVQYLGMTLHNEKTENMG